MSASFGFLSSFPPTQCGLATFTAALEAEIAAAGHETGVVRVLERPAPWTGSTVVSHMVHGEPRRGGTLGCGPQRVRRGGGAARVRHL